MTALVHLDFSAFVDVAVEGFVTVVAAVGDLVADPLVVDALTVCALELARGAGRVLVFLTIKLIRVIPTIVLPVTPVSVPDTLEVMARELLRRTRFVHRMAFLPFVTSVTAIVVVIARPALIDTSSVGAGELVG